MLKTISRDFDLNMNDMLYLHIFMLKQSSEDFFISKCLFLMYHIQAVLSQGLNISNVWHNQ